MTENHIAGLPVVDKDGTVVGVVTDTDLLRLLVATLKEAEALHEALNEVPGASGG
jgi:CBS domain-containing protein